MHRLAKYEKANDYPAGDPRHARVAVCTCGWRSASEEEANDWMMGDLRRQFEAHQRSRHEVEGIFSRA